MNTRRTLFATILLATGTTGVQAAEGQVNVVCSYHHTAGDDAIMMPGMPGMAMLHDFFGNTHTDAVSRYATLQEKPHTTCDNKADASAYWAPTMKLPDGRIVSPAYQKTYYQADDVAHNPVQPFPAGLELLAGDHHGSTPPKQINFFCAGGNGYFNKMGRICGPRSPGGPVQFNIGLRFPNCWDGKNLKPSRGHPNGTYAVNNHCPADFPVKIPTVNMNIAWVFPDLKSLDTRKIQLSMDPDIVNGKRIEKWGSLYTAHADFMNGWTVDGARFMTDHCLNLAMQCGLNVPYSMSVAQESSYVDSDNPQATHGGESQVYIEDNWTPPGRDAHPQKLALLKFTIPPLPDKQPPEDAALFKYSVRLYGSNVTDTATRILHVYAVSDDWQADRVNWKNRPQVVYTDVGTLRHGSTPGTIYFDVDRYVRQQAALGKKTVSFYIGGERQGREFAFAGTKSTTPPLLLVKGMRHTPVP